MAAASRSRRGPAAVREAAGGRGHSSAAVPHSLRPSLDLTLTRTIISKLIMKSLSHSLWLRREARASERGQFRAKQDWGAARPVVRILYYYRPCTPFAASLLLTWGGHQPPTLLVPLAGPGEDGGWESLGGPRRFLYIVGWDCSR